MSQLLKALMGLVLAGVFFGFVMFFGLDNSVGPVHDDLALASLNESRRPLSLRSILEAQRQQMQVEDVAPRTEKPAVDRAASRAKRLPELEEGTHAQAVYEDVPNGDVEKAIRLIDSGDVEGAIALLEDVLKNDPRNEQALVEMAMIHLLDLRRPAQAIDYLQKVIGINPTNRVVMTELVSLYEEEGRVDEGLQFMLEAQQANPESGEVAYGVGQMMVVQGRDEEAIPHLRKAAEGSEDPVRAGRELAEAWARVGNAEQAVEAYQTTIKRQEEDLKTRSTQGMPTSFVQERVNFTKMDMVRQLMNLGRWDEAEKILHEVQEDMPGDQNVLSLAERVRERRPG